MKKLIVLTMAIALVIAFGGPSAAYYIDFTSYSPTMPMGHQWVSPTGITFTAIDAGLNPTPNAALWHDSVDGFGVTGAGYEPDEIELPEALWISFPTPVYVVDFQITDLFYEGPAGSEYYEVGLYIVDDGTTVSPVQSFVQNNPAAVNGVFTLTLNQWVTDIYFSAPGIGGWGGIANPGDHHEFSVAGVNIVPIPGAVWLLGSGLIGLIGLRRKFGK